MSIKSLKVSTGLKCVLHGGHESKARYGTGWSSKMMSVTCPPSREGDVQTATRSRGFSFTPPKTFCFGQQGPRSNGMLVSFTQNPHTLKYSWLWRLPPFLHRLLLIKATTATTPFKKDELLVVSGAELQMMKSLDTSLFSITVNI